MAHESFEDAHVAAILNDNFVSIKVDREERPDLDQIYMAAVQAMTGGGGWPMSVFLTPAATILRRNLLPAGATPWAALVHPGSPGDRRRLAQPPPGARDQRAQLVEAIGHQVGFSQTWASSVRGANSLDRDTLHSAFESGGPV